MDAFIRKIKVPKWRKWKTAEEFDYFSEGVGISFAGDDRSKTYCGFFTTLGILAFGAYLFQYYLVNALDTTSPKIQFDIITEAQALTYNTSNSDLNFFFLLPDPTIVVNISNGSYTDLPSEYIPPADLYGNYSDPNLDPNVANPGGLSNDSMSNGSFRRRLEDWTERRRVESSTMDGKTRSRRLLQQVTSTYLSFDTYRKYFDITCDYVQSKNRVVKGKTVTDLISFPIELVPCQNATWLNDEKYKKFIDQNEYARDVIKDNAFCLNLNKSHNVFGNWLTSAESFIEIEIALCDPKERSTCDPNVYTIFDPSKYQNLLVGSFSSTVNNSNYEEPFVRDFYSHGDLLLNTIMTNYMDVLYKRIQVATDQGKLFEDVKYDFVGIIDEVGLVTRPAMTYDFVADKFSINPDGLVAHIEIKGTSRINQYKRSYDKFFDFMGNWGGGMEFIFICATLLAVYMEEHVKENRMKNVTMKQLGLKPLIKKEVELENTDAGFFKKLCCKKHAKLDMEPYIEELTERSISLEQLVKNSFLADIVNNSLIPKEVQLMAPILYAIEKSKEEQSSDKDQDKSNAIKYADSPEKQSGEKEMTLQEALVSFSSPEFDRRYPTFVALKQKLMPHMPDAEKLLQVKGHSRYETEIPIITPVQDNAVSRYENVPDDARDSPSVNMNTRGPKGATHNSTL